MSDAIVRVSDGGEYIGAEEEAHLETFLAREAVLTFIGPKVGNMPFIRSSDDVAHFVRVLLANKTVEHFVVLGLNARHEVIAWNTSAIGGETTCAVSVSVVMRFLVYANAVAFIVAHNHPSGDPRPSADDLAITKRIDAAGNLLGIKLLDHVIVGDVSTYSLDEKGVLR